MARLAFILTLLVVPGTVAVRKAELDLEDDSMDNDNAEQHSLEEEHVSKNHIGVNPGFAGDRDCCCRAGPCSRADELASLSMDRQLENVTGVSCCQNISSANGWFRGAFKCRGGDIVDVNVCNYEEPIASSIENCQAKMTWWLRRDDWYKMLPDSSAPRMAYESFVPCLHLKHVHVNEIVLSKLSYFWSGSATNPLRYYVVSRPECGALPAKDLMSALERSYDDLCPFPMPTDDYRPNLRPERACAFNKTTQAVHMSRKSRCPEGHKCACPVHNTELTAGGETEKWRSSFSIFGYLTSFSTGSILVHPLQGIVLTGTLATASIAAGAASWLAFPYLAVAGTGLMVYGGRAGVQYVTHSCNAKAGCYPLDCVYEEAVDGCRINLDTDESDIRNPYWFMPPPMYKCGVSRWGNCQMSACTAEDARQQTVGEGIATWGLRGRGRRSVLSNCQPMLAQDMSHTQAYNFENQVKDIRAKEHEVARRTTIMLDQLHRYCPYLQPSDFMSAALCNDGTTCQMETKDGPPCCLFNGGVRQCPVKFPKMCDDGRCDSEITGCEENGGLKECPAESRCPWIISRIEDNVVECQSGQIFNTSDFVSPTPWCGGEGGLKTCPWNAPYMCESKSCDGEHCCAADCTDLGGMRVCSGLAQVQPLQSAAPVKGPMSAQVFTFGLTLLSMFFMRPLH